MATDEKLGLRVEGDVANIDAALRQIATMGGVAGAGVGKLTLEFGKAEAAAKKVTGLDWAKVATGLNQAVELAGRFAGKAVEIAKFSAEMKNLEARVPVERLRMMQAATDGAVMKTDLMRFSLKAMSGEMRLTEGGLNAVMKAADTLGDQGFGDTMENAEKLLSALRKGSSKELKEFGIALTDTKDKTANVNAMLAKFKEVAEQEVHVDEGLKRIELVQAAWGDFVSDVKTGLGSIILQIGEGIAQLLGLIDQSRQGKINDRARASARLGGMGAGAIRADLLTMGPVGGFGAQIFGGLGVRKAGAQEGQDILDYTARQAVGLQFAVKQDQVEAAFQKAFNDTLDEVNAAKLGKDRGWAGKVAGSKAGTDKSAGWWQALLFNAQRDTSFLQADLAAAGAGGLDVLGNLGTGREALATDFLGGLAGGVADAEKVNGARIADFEAQIKDHTTAIGAGYDIMRDSIVASVDAAISGSESIGQAARKASAQALKAIAIECAVKALYSTAEAIFTRDPSKLVAAGKYAAAAAAAGVGSAVLGAGGGGGGGYAGGPGSAPGGGFASNRGVGGGGGTQENHYHIHGTVSAATHRELGGVMERSRQKALRSGGVTSEHLRTSRME
jgi:hypothetical protein